MTKETEKKIKEFIEIYKNLEIGEKYSFGKLFNQETGGRLSPHNNPLTVAVAIIKIKDDDGSIKLLGLKRGIQPFVGGVAFPGGYSETLESAQDAAARELKEELGLDLKGHDFEVFGNPLMSPANNELLFFKHKDVFPKSLLNSIKLSNEALEYVLIDKNTEMCFPHHKSKSLDVLKQPESKDIKRLESKAYKLKM